MPTPPEPACICGGGCTRTSPTTRSWWSKNCLPTSPITAGATPAHHPAGCGVGRAVPGRFPRSYDATVESLTPRQGVAAYPTTSASSPAASLNTACPSGAHSDPAPGLAGLAHSHDLAGLGEGLFESPPGGIAGYQIFRGGFEAGGDQWDPVAVVVTITSPSSSSRTRIFLNAWRVTCHSDTWRRRADGSVRADLLRPRHRLVRAARARPG
jgi:hypothetical protein